MINSTSSGEKHLTFKGAFLLSPGTVVLSKYFELIR